MLENLHWTSIAIGGFITLLASYTLRSWQYERDRWIGRVDYFIDKVEITAEKGVEYWLNAGSSRNADQIAEIKLIGLQSLLDGLFQTFSSKLSKSDRVDVQHLISTLRGELTGGEFQSAALTQNHDRARAIQACATDLIIGVRKAADRSMRTPVSIFIEWFAGPRQNDG